MHQLKIGVGWSAMKLRLGYNTNQELWTKIDQHKVILNKSICDYYLRCGQNQGVDEDLIHQMIQDIIPYSTNPGSKSCDLKEILSSYFKTKTYDECVIIAEACDELQCSRSVCRNQYSIREAIEDEKGVLALYTSKYDYDLVKGTPGKPVMRWIHNFLKDEDEISIIDPHLFDHPQGEYTFYNYYLEMLKPNAMLNLHLSERYSDVDIKAIKTKCEDNNVRTRFFLYKDREIHDRYITTHDAYISIGLGLDILDKNNDDAIRTTTTARYSKKKQKYLNVEMAFEKEKAGGEPVRIY